MNRVPRTATVAITALTALAWLLVVILGADDFPFPIPVVPVGDSWRFDTPAGQEEILNRRIGRNERATIQVCLAYVDAQRE